MYTDLHECVSGFDDQGISRSPQMLSLSGLGPPKISIQAVKFQSSQSSISLVVRIQLMYIFTTTTNDLTNQMIECSMRRLLPE